MKFTSNIGLWLIIISLSACRHMQSITTAGGTRIDSITSVMCRAKAHTSEITKPDGTILRESGDDDQTRAAALQMWGGIGEAGATAMGSVAREGLKRIK